MGVVDTFGHSTYEFKYEIEYLFISSDRSEYFSQFMRNSDQHNLNAGKNLVLQNSTLVFICMFIEPKKETNKKTMTCCFHNLNADNNLVLNTKFNACSYLYVY